MSQQVLDAILLGPMGFAYFLVKYCPLKEFIEPGLRCMDIIKPRVSTKRYTNTVEDVRTYIQVWIQGLDFQKFSEKYYLEPRCVGLSGMLGSWHLGNQVCLMSVLLPVPYCMAESGACDAFHFGG